MRGALKRKLAEKEKVDLIIAEIQDKAQALEARRREALAGVDKNILSV